MALGDQRHSDTSLHLSGLLTGAQDFLDRVLDWGRLAPNRIAHVSSGRSISYGELVARARSFGAWLDQTLPADVSPVALVGHREPDLLVGMLGCALTNHPYVPIDDSSPQARIDRIADIARVGRMVTAQEIATLGGDVAALRPHRRGDDDPYYVMFTSGSSGEPKGVVITRRAVATFIDWLTAEHNFALGAEVFLNQANLSFDLSVMDVYGALTTGGTLVSATRDHVENQRDLHAMLRTAGITTWVSTPTFAAMCLAEPTFSYETVCGVRRFLFCGEVLPVETARALLNRFPGAEVWNTYGPTEATVATTSIRIDRATVERGSPLPVGVPMPASRVECVDESLRPVPAGKRGEIVIIGPNVSVGYLNRPDLSERAFFECDGMRGYRTGDWGRFENGLLYCEGRMDSQIKLHGYRIELGEIETQLRSAPGVRDAVVVPSLRDGRPSSLTAAVLVDPMPADARTEAETLRRLLAERLPTYMVPRHVRFLTTFPMTPNGKADRTAIARAIARAR